MMKIDFRRLQHYVYNGNGVQSDKDLIDNHKINYFSLRQKFQFSIKNITPFNDCRSVYGVSGLKIWRAHIMYVVLKHDDVIKRKHFAPYWPYVRGIHQWPVNSPHKGQWRGALMDSLICAWINGWTNKHEARNLRRHRAHYDVTVMS